MRWIGLYCFATSHLLNWEKKMESIQNGKKDETRRMLFRPIDAQLIWWRSENENICREYKWKLVVAHCSSVYYMDFSLMNGMGHFSLNLNELNVVGKKRVVSEINDNTFMWYKKLNKSPGKMSEFIISKHIVILIKLILFFTFGFFPIVILLFRCFAVTFSMRFIFVNFVNYFVARLVAWLFFCFFTVGLAEKRFTSS